MMINDMNPRQSLLARLQFYPGTCSPFGICPRDLAVVSFSLQVRVQCDVSKCDKSRQCSMAVVMYYGSCFIYQRKLALHIAVMI
jgi:hypothetical protein